MVASVVLARQVSERRATPVPPTPRQLLRRALNRRELEVHYQPVFDAHGSLAGAEALIRWHHPTLGLIDPGAILKGVHEGTELDDLTDLVLSDACAALGRLQPLIIKNGYLGVNIPAAILEHERLPQMVESALATAGVSGSGLVLELTETSEVKDWDAVRLATQRLRPLGVRLALDDFGRGHSNLPALSTSNADIVKLDKALLDEVLINERAGEIVDSVITLASSLQMHLVAEGIEDLGVLEWLMDRPVTYFQGYALGCPQPLDELVDGQFRQTPMPALAGLPHQERGSIALPALISLTLVACSLLSSAGALRQWTITREAATHTGATGDTLERAYLAFVGASHRSTAALASGGRSSNTASESDLTTVRGLELVDAIEKAHSVDLHSGDLERADWLAEPARRFFEAGKWNAASEEIFDVVVPAVRTYLVGRNGLRSPAVVIDDLSGLLSERVATLGAYRHAAGLDSEQSSSMALRPLPGAAGTDPIVSWFAAWRSERSTPLIAAGLDDQRIQALTSVWPALVDPSSDAIAAIDFEQVADDNLSLQLTLEEQVDTHHLSDWATRRPTDTSAPGWAWLASASIAPAIGLAALLAWLLSAPTRHRRRFKLRHPVNLG
jgi:EAL domain-containing protein (putative c-di-GMP-specific phosphodiesterase class I)